VFNGMIAVLACRRAELETNLSLLGATLESTGDGILVVDRDRKVTLSNARFAELWRLPQDLVDSRDDARLLAYAMAQIEEPRTFLDRVEAIYRDLESVSEDVLTFRDGRVFERFSMPQWINGRVVGRVWRFGDITRRKHAEDELRLAAAVFTHAGEGIMISDVDGTIRDVNASFLRLTGYERDEIIGRQPSLLRSGRHRNAFYEAMWRGLQERGVWSGEVWNRGKDGSIHPVRLTITAVPGAAGVTRHYVALYTDISAQVQHQEALEHVAHHDPLTDLPNRLLLGQRLQQAMARAEALQHWLAIAYLDLDGFKAVNDAHGHAAGDRLLVIAAKPPIYRAAWRRRTTRHRTTASTRSAARVAAAVQGRTRCSRARMP
jgi:PAS domain S-box-containing protein